MATLREDVLVRDLKNGTFAPGYLLFGADSYLKKMYADRLLQKTAGADNDLDVGRFGESARIQEVYDAVGMYPMLCERRFVELLDFDFEHADAESFEQLSALAENLCDSCVFVLRFEGIAPDFKKNARAKKLAAAFEKGGGKVVELGFRTPAELAKMLCDGAKKRGVTLSAEVARALVERVGTDITLLSSELEKLCAYKAGGEISAEDLETLCAKTVEASVFDLSAKIFAGDLSGALVLLDDLFFMRVEPMVILGTLTASFVDLFRLAAAEKGGVSRADVARDFGYKNRAFVLDRAARVLKRTDGAQVNDCLAALCEADRALKSFSADERTVLEKLTVTLCRILHRSEGTK